jgi:hypothetical protein
MSPSFRPARDNTGLERGRKVEGDADSNEERVNHPNQTRMTRPDFNLTSSITVDAVQTQSGDKKAEGVKGIKYMDTNVYPPSQQCNLCIRAGIRSKEKID